MDAGSDELPDDVATLKAMVIAGREREARMQHLIDQLRRAQFGQRSEKLSSDQLALALDDLDVAGAELVALGEQLDDAAARMGQKRTRKAPDGERGSLPAHLPRIEIVIPPAETECPCCDGALHVIDEDRASRLDTIPVPYRVVVTVH